MTVPLYRREKESFLSIHRGVIGQILRCRSDRHRRMETNATSLLTDWRRMLQWVTRDWRLCLKSVFQVPSFMFQVDKSSPLET